MLPETIGEVGGGRRRLVTVAATAATSGEPGHHQHGRRLVARFAAVNASNFIRQSMVPKPSGFLTPTSKKPQSLVPLS